jgi:adenylylsulfate kinase-like enzyme
METVIKYILSLISPFLNDLNLIRDLKVDNLKSFKETYKKLPLKYIINKDNLLLYKGKLYV